MTEQVQTSKAGKGLGIAGLVLGILGLVLCWIPIIGVLGLVLAVVGMILSIVGMIQANKNNGSKGVIIAALVLSVVATGIGSWVQWKTYKAAKRAASMMQDGMKDFEKQMKEATDQMQQQQQTQPTQ